MGRTITNLPNDIDPVKLINQKMLTCPMCGCQKIMKYRSEDKYCDVSGEVHKLLRYLNKYRWVRYSEVICQNCGCKWDTGWYPQDHKMFQIPVDKDKDDINQSVEKILKNLGITIGLPILSDIDLQELEDRFGKNVRIVVEDMLSGENKRWADNFFDSIDA